MAQEIPLTQKELREMLIDIRQTKDAVSELSRQMKEMHQIVAGNGRYNDSLVGRLQMVEERQKVGAKKQDEVCDKLDALEVAVAKHNSYLEKNHVRISELEESQKKILEAQTGLKDTIDSWRNKAIGIGIGVGIGTGGGLFALAEIINKVTGSIP